MPDWHVDSTKSSAASASSGSALQGTMSEQSSKAGLPSGRALLFKGGWGEPASSQSSSAAASAGDADINRLSFEVQVSAIPDALPNLPWEVGPFKHIFGSDLGVEAPVFRMPVPLAAPETACPPPVPVTRDKAGKRVHACLFHSCALKSRNEDEMTEDTLWCIALSKWRTIFALTNHQGQVGSMLVDSFWAGDDRSREATIRDVMGLKAPRTAYKRANELLRCFQFHIDKLGSAWPWDNKSVASYLKTLEGSKGEASATLGLFQAMRFAFHVLDIPFENSLLADKRMQGRAKRLVADSGPLKQAEALLVQQVIQVELKLVDSETCDQDRFLIGGMLFALYSRSRWSDLRYLDFIVFDLDEGGVGFIEAQTFYHKTRNTRKASKRAMPLVCPAVSLAGVDWISAWLKAGVNLGFDWEARPLGALVLTPCETGLTKRRCSSSEATELLRNLLDLDSSSGVSSHSLKATTLTWCGKRGLSESDCLLLDHHVTGSKSRAVYSRELLSAPLRAYAALIQEICDGDFRPDSSRSGWLSEKALLRLCPDRREFASELEPPQAAAQQDSPGMTREEFNEILGGGTPEAASQDKSESFVCVEAPGEVASPKPSERGGEESDVEPTSSSSSSSESSSGSPSEGGNALREEKLLQEAGAAQEFDIPGPLWQHYKSKMLHKAAGDCKTICGRHAKSPVFDYLPRGSVSRWTRCSVCFKHEVIRSRKQLGDALEALTSHDSS